MKLDTPPTAPRAPQPAPRPEIRTFRELRGYVAEDYKVNLREFWSPGFQAAATYRLGVWCNSIQTRALRGPVRVVYRLLRFVSRNFYGIELYPSTQIGRRLRIAHQHGIVVHPQSILGDDCILRQGVTIGKLRATNRAGPPIIGDRVEIGAGAVIVGAVRVGDDAVIGPNAVVMTNVPAGAMVASPQSRIMRPPPRTDSTARAPAEEGRLEESGL